MAQVVLIQAIVGKEIFVEKRIVSFYAGCVPNTDVQNTALILSSLVVKRQGNLRLSVIHVQKKIKRTASMTSTITWQKRLRQMQRKQDPIQEKGFV